MGIALSRLVLSTYLRIALFQSMKVILATTVELVFRILVVIVGRSSKRLLCPPPLGTSSLFTLDRSRSFGWSFLGLD